MTPNDAQIDVLMRRYAGQARSDAAPEHLDADELNAFAEGSVPPATRARYVSHLADCDNCRQLVSQLAMSAGAIAKTEAQSETQTSTERHGDSWSQRVAAFFAPRTLRYAAFAVVLVAAAGALFLVARRPPNSALVARNEPANQTSVTAVKPDAASVPQPSVGGDARTATTEPGTISKAGQNSNLEPERDESKIATNTAPLPKPSPETLATSPPLAAKKAAEPAVSESSPSYAPPPPGEGQRVESRSREQQNVGGVATGPRKAESADDKFKMTDRARADEISKDSNRSAANQSPANNRRAGEEKPSGPRRNMDNVAATGRNTNEIRAEAPQAPRQSAGADKPKETPVTRSVGGRKFTQQGSAWVDTKFKSSMSLRNVSRGSDEFSSLDSGLRSIASQLGGEIIVVWKNKAYRIR